MWKDVLLMDNRLELTSGSEGTLLSFTRFYEGLVKLQLCTLIWGDSLYILIVYIYFNFINIVFLNRISPKFLLLLS